MKRGIIITNYALLAIIPVILNIWSCGGCITGPGPDKFDGQLITGLIGDKVTRQPIDSAWIKAYNPDIDRLFTAYSDSSGKYTLGLYVDSNWLQEINIGKIGYITFDTMVLISIPQEDFDTVDIYLEPE
jgi:hypothetical protein